MERNLYKIENELYIVDNTEEINKDTKTCWCIDISCNELVLHQGVLPSHHYKHYKKIIMTTDKSINVLCSCGKDCGAKESGVQDINNEFLEWFLKNPSCEEVKIKKHFLKIADRYGNGYRTISYLAIIIPTEEPKQEYCDNCNNDMCCCIIKKQETLEKAAEIYSKNWGGSDHEQASVYTAFINAAKWEQERSYSEEEVWKLLNKLNETLNIGSELTLEEWFEQFKKK